jgi:hypothetical protein
MKTSNSVLFKVCILLGLSLLIQFSFATDPVPIPKDGNPPPQPLSPTMMLAASATISDTELAIFFDWSVGPATITVYDSSNNVVYREVVDTYTTMEVYIPVDTWDSGKYMLTVTYGKTTQRGYFKLK